MKKTNIFHKFGTFLMAAAFSASLITTAFAADSVITYKGRTEGFTFAPGSEYTTTDLFENFKNVMPGDEHHEQVMIKNAYRGCDEVRVWMSALLHTEEGNPISENVLEELKADDRKGTMTELEYMHDFLDQLTLTVKKGDQVVYSGCPSSLEQGFEDGANVYLGKLKYNESMDLDVQLSVDIEMGNEYTDRIGEVDWIFLVEERDNPDDDPDSPGGGGGKDPSPKPTPTPEDTVIIYPSDVPLSGPDDVPIDVIGDIAVAPKTGDDTQILPYLIILVCGILGMGLTLFGKRKRAKHSQE